MSQSKQKSNPVRVFFSYCHKDEKFRSNLMKHLNLLEKQNLIKEWYDGNILPGDSISDSIRKKLEEADIVLFLISANFIASDECMKEWENAKISPTDGRIRHRIPIVLSHCAWRDLLENDKIKVLPNDAKPVVEYKNEDAAWLEVYEGIKEVALNVREHFTHKPTFLSSMEHTELISESNIKLQDIFEFLTLSRYRSSKKSSSQISEDDIENKQQLFLQKHCLIHGESTSGKTALARYLYLSLVDDLQSVLLINLKESKPPVNIPALKKCFETQLNGDFSLWMKKINKTIIIDNLSFDPSSVKFINFVLDNFDRVIVIMSTDIYRMYYQSDENFIRFKVMKIKPLSYRQQESLIRKRLDLMNREKPVPDGFVDQVDSTVNAIIADKIVPRYPFFVLSIVQTYEGFIQEEIKITAYGHCYYVLIISSLIKSGIEKTDINACFNFAQQLAFAIYEHKESKFKNFTHDDFELFVENYLESYHIAEHLINRMKHGEYGIISNEVGFRIPFMYYYFLGKFLSKSGEKQRHVIDNMCQNSQFYGNHLTLLFVIHHSDNNEVIDDILIQTMCAFDVVPPATLRLQETRKFQDILRDISENVLSDKSVSEERAKSRIAREKIENNTQQYEKDLKRRKNTILDDLYRILKNNEILGQVLKNKYVTMEKHRIEEIINVVTEGGLRLVNLILKDDYEITKFAIFFKKVNPNFDIGKLKRELQFLSFFVDDGKYR